VRGRRSAGLVELVELDDCERGVECVAATPWRGPTDDRNALSVVLSREWRMRETATPWRGPTDDRNALSVREMHRLGEGRTGRASLQAFAFVRG
jgi:hypothetical protein